MFSAVEFRKFLVAFAFTIAGFSLLFFVLTAQSM
jgi:hypothetical protein